MNPTAALHFGSHPRRSSRLCLTRLRHEKFLHYPERSSTGGILCPTRIHFSTYEVAVISELLTDLRSYKENTLDPHPIFTRLAAGDFTRFHYLAYLRETYYLVKHTPRYLTAAADQLATRDERFPGIFFPGIFGGSVQRRPGTSCCASKILMPLARMWTVYYPAK